MSVDVLVVGVGVVGAHIIELLAREASIGAVAAIDRDGPRGEAIVWRAKLGAHQQGHHKAMTFRAHDLNDVEATTRLIEDLAPRVIVHTATLVTVPEMARRLEPPTFQAIRAHGFAPWLPLHLSLSVKLIEACKRSRLPPALITAPFPDMANQVLARCGLAPITGLGNVDNVSSDLHLIAAERLRVHPRDVQVYLTCHHGVAESLQRTATVGGFPFHAHVVALGRDVTGEIDIEAALGESARRCQGIAIESRVASSALKLIAGVLGDDGRLAHGAGPAGEPGGYPIRLYADRAELALPPGLSIERARAINLEVQRASGLEAVDETGALHLTQDCRRFMRELSGLDLPVIRVAELDATALALRQALEQMVAERR
jgi:hypothetical protein